MESNSYEMDLRSFFSEKGIDLVARDNKKGYFGRATRKFKQDLSSLLPDLGILFRLKNNLLGLGYCGEGTSIRGKFTCNIPENVFLGDKVFINYDCMLISDDLILVGSNVLIGPRVGIFTSNHYLQKDKSFGLEKYSVEIHNNSWIGAYSIILPGVTISEGTQIGAGSVVTKSTEPYKIYAGNPARRIKEIDVFSNKGESLQ